MSKKIPIHFSNKDLADVNSLIDLLGLSHTYGAIPKAVKLSITLAKIHLNNMAKVIPGLNGVDLDILLASIKKIKLDQYKANLIQNIEKEPEKYNLEKPESIT